ncbi:rCG25037 [Rattus norvegicus]|uniref:RCG25037 n=1 Tax=Rattus norvegicus TaxID=10116 RepID=A6KFE2_RAT|nr:rCG25037 [Rattus norvegicus]
MLSCLDFM